MKTESEKNKISRSLLHNSNLLRAKQSKTQKRLIEILLKSFFLALYKILITLSSHILVPLKIDTRKIKLNSVFLQI